MRELLRIQQALCVLLLSFIFFGGNIFADESVNNIAVQNTEKSLPNTIGAACSSSCSGGLKCGSAGTCQKDYSQSSTSGGSGNTTNGGSGASVDAQRRPDTSTQIPNPLPNGYCEDLLACNKIAISGMFNLRPGIQETYVYKNMIPQIIKLLLNFGSGIAVLMTVYAGMRFLVSGGDSAVKTQAVKIIGYSIAGILVMILSRAIVSIVENLPLG